MRFYSGFCFKNEFELFQNFLDVNEFSIVGFSYGAIKAFEYVYKSKQRVEKLILLSPAFFQEKDEKFKKLQLIFFKKNSSNYLKNFYENVLYPSNFEIDKYKKMGTYEELKELLHYEWNKEKLKELKNRGVKIEIYLGKKDKIIDSTSAYEFFKSFGTVYFIKNVGHLLVGRER